jgi:hypothetical protein
VLGECGDPDIDEECDLARTGGDSDSDDSNRSGTSEPKGRLALQGAKAQPRKRRKLSKPRPGSQAQGTCHMIHYEESASTDANPTLPMHMLPSLHVLPL